MAGRIERIQEICFELGLNCYFETHMNMISVSAPVTFTVGRRNYEVVAHHMLTVNIRGTAAVGINASVFVVLLGGPSRICRHHGSLSSLL